MIYACSCFAPFPVLTSLIDSRVYHERMKYRHWPEAICIDLTPRSPNKKIAKRNTEGHKTVLKLNCPMICILLTAFFS